MGIEKKGFKFLETHEWINVSGNIGRVGLSKHAVKELNEVIFIELPEVGVQVSQGKPFGTVESVKAVFDLNSPVTGKVINVNQSIKDSPEKVTSDPYEEGWMIEIELSDISELNSLMDYEEYNGIYT
ncbi:MAG: glycine cleavage system protein GcvH [bacterium]|nr:glycine cleavage system protein GcvH [bacterium]